MGKGKRQDQPERRRSLIEINLGSHGKPRGGKTRPPKSKRRGRTQLFVLALALALALGAGLMLWVRLH